MDANVILSAIGSVGFPIVACCGLFYLYDKTIKEITASLNKINSTLDIFIEEFKQHNDNESGGGKHAA